MNPQHCADQSHKDWITMKREEESESILDDRERQHVAEENIHFQMTKDI